MPQTEQERRPLSHRERMRAAGERQVVSSNRLRMINLLEPLIEGEGARLIDDELHELGSLLDDRMDGALLDEVRDRVVALSKATGAKPTRDAMLALAACCLRCASNLRTDERGRRRGVVH